jgi:hypothetical protein
VFEGSHIPVAKWLMGIHLMSASKKAFAGFAARRFFAACRFARCRFGGGGVCNSARSVASK